MGKKRKKTTQKTKKISVAMAEASSTGGEDHSTSSTPRKRGRPRKTVFEEEFKDVSESEDKLKGIETHVAQKQEQEENQQNQQEELTEASHMAEKRESLKEEQPKSRARRKGKPHKSC